ncbi:MAG: hypothetical protein ACRERC_07860 [Candidatus Binatia bacterium]
MAIVRFLSTPLSVAVLCALLAGRAAGQGAYPRGDATCSVDVSAADLVATARGLGGASTCANDDCDRDGLVTPADRACVAGCLFDACPVPAHAAHVTAIAPDSALAVVPASVVRIAVDNLGPVDAIKRVTIGGLEAEVIEQTEAELLVALPAELPTGPAEVVVFDGDLAGAAFTIDVAPGVPLGAPDTLDGTLELIDTLLAALLTLDLEGVYGESTALLRQEVDRARTELAAERAALASDPGLSEADRLHLDAAFDASGVPEMLRASIAEIEASAGLEAAGVTATAADAARLIRGAARTLKVARAVGAAAAGTLTAPVAAGIAVGTAIVAGALVFAASDPLTPLIFGITYVDAEGDSHPYPTAGGIAVIRGARFDTLTTSLLIQGTIPFHGRDATAGTDSINFRLPDEAGFCGKVVFTLERTGGFKSNPVPTRIQPELLQLPASAKFASIISGEARGTNECDPVALFEDRRTDEVLVLSREGHIIRMQIPELLPRTYRVGLRVQGLRSLGTEDLDIDVTNAFTGLSLTCPTSIKLPDGVPPSSPSICTVVGQPPYRVPDDALFRWESSSSSRAAITDITELPHALLTPREPGTTRISATLESSLSSPPILARSNVVEVAVEDQTNPKITLSSATTSPVPPGGSIVVTVNASDNHKLLLVQLDATGDAVASGASQQALGCSGKKSCTEMLTITLKERDFAQSTVTVRATATDQNGHNASSNTLTFAVGGDDTTCPVVSFVQPVAGGTVNAGESVTVIAMASDAGPIDTGVKRLVGTASGAALVAPASVDVPLPVPRPSAELRFPFKVKDAKDLVDVVDRSIVISVDAFDAAMEPNHCGPQSITVNVIGVFEGCSGDIRVDNPSGFIGDPFTITVALTGAGADQITRVISTNPGGTFDLQSQGGGVYTVTLFYQNKGGFTLTFVALNAAGEERCSGSTALESLGPRETEGGAFLQGRRQPAGAGLR